MEECGVLDVVSEAGGEVLYLPSVGPLPLGSEPDSPGLRYPGRHTPQRRRIEVQEFGGVSPGL